MEKCMARNGDWDPWIQTTWLLVTPRMSAGVRYEEKKPGTDIFN